MKKKNLIIVIAFAVLMSMAIVPAAFAERGVTDTEIRIGQYGPQSGPAALWGAVARGTGCYFDMINAEGGINGRKIKYFLRDDGYMAPRTKAICKELVESKEVFAMASGVGTSPGMAVKRYLHKKKVPWIGPATGSTHWAFPPTKYLFAVYPLYIDEAAILVNYAVKEMGKKRIAFFYQNDDYGKEGLAGAEYALKKLGMELAASVSVEVMDTDLSSHCMKLKQANPDCVINWLLPKQGKRGRCLDPLLGHCDVIRVQVAADVVMSELPCHEAGCTAAYEWIHDEAAGWPRHVKIHLAQLGAFCISQRFPAPIRRTPARRAKAEGLGAWEYPLP